MRIFDNKNKLAKFSVLFAIILTLSTVLVTTQIRGNDRLNIEKIVLKFEENDAFSIEPYIDCLYKLNMDISNKCIESEIKLLISKGDASEALDLIKALDENKEKFIINCQYLAERIGKVFNDITDLESLLVIDFGYCNYGFQMGVFGEIDEGFLKDKNNLALFKNSCSKYIAEGEDKERDNVVCHEGIANILTLGPSKLGPIDSRNFCLAIGDPKGVCLKSLLKNYLGVGSSKVSKKLFSDKESVVETLLNFCKSETVDNTRNCLAEAIANIFAHNEKLVYLVADYCSKVKKDIGKNCHREIAKGFNIATESSFIKENSDPGLAGEMIYQDSLDKVVDKVQIFKVFTDNQPKYCNFLEEVAKLSKEYVDQCYIGFALVLLEYYEIEKGKVCEYFNKKEYKLCEVAIKINSGKNVESRYIVE